MKYLYEKPDKWDNVGIIYKCDHPMYNRCTLFKVGESGVAVIQEHFNEQLKTRWWGSVDPWIASDIYSNKNFRQFFDKNAAKCDNNKLYPTIKVRELMWALRMKPLKKEAWEIF